MGLKYVLNSMKRRKLRTFIIVLALTIGVALVGALLNLVDTQRQFSIQSLASQTGGYDIAITKSDLAETTFFDAGAVASTVQTVNSDVAAFYGRIVTSAEARAASAYEGSEVTVVALDPVSDTLISLSDGSTTASTSGIRISFGTTSSGGGRGGGPGGGGGAPPGGGGAPPSGSTRSGGTRNTTGSTASGATSSNAGAPPAGAPPDGMTPPDGAMPPDMAAGGPISGTMGTMSTTVSTYPPKAGEVYLDSDTASTLGVNVGDEITLAYALPVQREVGSTVISGTSTPRISMNFTVGGVGTLSGLGSTSNAIIMRLDDAQNWLSQAGQVNTLLLVWESGKSSTDARATVSSARDTGEEIRATLQSQLGDEFEVSLPKYTRLESSSQSFTFTQTFITLYGMLSMGIVGLMVNALMTTTVNEQKHDLAVLRVLGSPRNRMFETVIIEVVILGGVGIVLGLLLGRAVTDYIMVPILLANLDLSAGTRAAWTLQTVLTPTLITIVVLALATISPARTAAATKVMTVLNPAAADQPSLEDLAKLRERRPNFGLLIAGLVLLAFSAVVLIVLPTVFTSGNATGQVIVNFGSLLLMVIGISFLFFFFTTPLERVLVRIYRIISPKAAFFAGRYALRGKGRNALISLMVVMSGVLPTLLSTQMVLQSANVETSSRFSTGAPLVASRQSSSGGGFPVFRRSAAADVELSASDIAAVTSQRGISNVVGVADNLPSMTVGDLIQLRTATVSLVGVEQDLNNVLYGNLMRWTEGDKSALTQITTDTDGAIISQGLSQSLDLHVGDTLRVKGAGTDHHMNLNIVGVAARIPGFSTYFQSSSSSANQSGVIVNLATYRELQHDPSTGALDASADVLTKLFATVQPNANQTRLLSELRNTLSNSNNMSVTATSEQVTRAQTNLQQQRVFILLLTGLSMVTAIFGVLAVMYTAVMGRRIEIGMLKAVGASRGAACSSAKLSSPRWLPASPASSPARCSVMPSKARRCCRTISRWCWRSTSPPPASSLHWSRSRPSSAPRWPPSR